MEAPDWHFLFLTFLQGKSPKSAYEKISAFWSVRCLLTLSTKFFDQIPWSCLRPFLAPRTHTETLDWLLFYFTFHKGNSRKLHCQKIFTRLAPNKKNFIQKSHPLYTIPPGRSIEDFTLTRGWAPKPVFVSRFWKKLGTRKSTTWEL